MEKKRQADYSYCNCYWKEARDLDEAQERKPGLTCRKLGLKSGDRVLDIGCDWGGFARYAAERHGVTVVVPPGDSSVQ